MLLDLDLHTIFKKIHLIRKILIYKKISIFFILIISYSKKMKRECGVLLAISSLPSSYGIGDFGKEAYRFVDFLVSSGQSLWQI